MANNPNSQAVADFDWESQLNDGQDAQTHAGTAPKTNLTPASSGDSSDSRPSMDLLLDIPLEITAELGRTRMIINDLLQLGQGSVIELNKLAGEPLEILVNHKLIARGEVVVVNEKFGIRLTDIISPIERIKQLA